MKKGIIIAGFAGIGKTTLAKKYKNVIDIESSPYKYDYSHSNTSDLEKLKGKKNRKLNSEFPKNYIDAVKDAQTKYDIVCVWIHPEEILPHYDKNNLDYYLVFPNKEALKEYKTRFIGRGNNVDFINGVFNHYDTMYKQLQMNPHKKFELNEGENLETLLLRIGVQLERNI